jgi:2-oxoisovalerate dehydrogenase E1 component beta subunit
MSAPRAATGLQNGALNGASNGAARSAAVASANGSAAGSGSAAVPTTLAKAINMGLRASMERDPKVLVMGEDVGKLGGVFRVTDGLQKDFGEHRVLDTPLAESGIIGTAVGLAMRGYRPVTEIQFDGFVFPGFDQIISQLAKLTFRTQGRVKMPVVVRIPYGGGIGAVEHHAEAPESFFCHIAGLRVVTCSNAADAYLMIQEAVACNDPVVFFEPKRRYWEKAPLDPAVVADSSTFSSVVRRPGNDVTVVSYGPSMPVLQAAAASAAGEGRSLELIDLRSLSPLDLDPVLASVRKTGRLVVVTEAPRESSISGDIAARVMEEAFYSLAAPVIRVAGADVPYPPSKLEDHYLPDLDKVLDAVDRVLAY